MSRDKDRDSDRTASMGDPENRPDRPRLERLGHFRIDATLGTGGMGTVYRAYDESMKRPVALKVLHASLELSERVQSRFVREAWIAGQLDHPNIVKVYSRGEENSVSYLAMELTDGGSLHDVIKQAQGQLPAGSDVTGSIDPAYIRDILTKFIQLAGALEHIHAKGFIHRDIKPHNILLAGANKQFKFTDFGIAHADDMTRMTRAGDFIGTVRYMSPELLAAHRAGIDKRTDIYSLGVTLYETLTLCLPFKADSEEKLIGEILAGHHIAARKCNRRIPVDLETVLMKACHHDPSMRYQTAAEFGEDLQRILDGRPILAHRPGMVTRSYKYIRRNYRPVLGIAAGVAVIAMIALWAYYQVEQARTTSGQPTSIAKSSVPTFTKIEVPGKTEYCALSPDGKKIAFVAEDKCLWVALTHGPTDPNVIGEPVRLTGPIAPNTLGSIPVWSADGRWIAFNGKGNNEDRWADTLGMYVIPSSGGEPQKLQVMHDRWDAYFDLRTSLSPDGKDIAFFSHTSPIKADSLKNCIYSMPVSGGEIRRIAGPDCGQPAYSPDGKMIAFVKGDLQPWALGDTVRSDVWVVPAMGGVPIRVSDMPGVVFSPLWSPDSRIIVFGKWEEHGGGYSIKKMYLSRLSETYEVIGHPMKIDLPLWWDGYHLCGWTHEGEIGIHLWSPGQRAGAIYKVSAAGGVATKVTAESGDDPRWSPDGEKIFYLRNDSLYCSPARGGMATMISVNEEIEISSYGFDISPDGKHLVFPALKSGESRHQIYTASVKGGKASLLFSSDSGEFFGPRWSPDGKWIAFDAFQDSRFCLCVVAANGGSIRELGSSGTCPDLPFKAWSPDSKRIAYTVCSPDSSHSITVLPLVGGTPELIVQLPRGHFASSLSWSPDGERLSYSSGLDDPQGSRDEYDLWTLSLDTKEPVKLRTGLDPDWVSGVEWSPDGEQIAFSCDWGGSSDFYLMENFLTAAKAGEPEQQIEPTFSKVEVRD